MTNVGLDVHAPLDQALELCVQIDGTINFMITELVMDGILDGVGGGIRNMNNCMNIFGNRIVNPAKDRLIKHDLARIMAIESGS